MRNVIEIATILQINFAAKRHHRLIFGILFVVLIANVCFLHRANNNTYQFCLNNTVENASRFSNALPVPRATHGNGSSTTNTGSPVA